MPLIELSVATFILLVIVALIIKFIWWIIKLVWKNFKITWFDCLLAIEFVIACIAVIYVVGDMIVHAQPIGHYTVTDYYREPPTETWCVQGHRSWKCQ